MTAVSAPRIDISPTMRTSFGRLVSVEFRKMYDTRAGWWLIALTGGLIVLALGIPLLIIALSDTTISAMTWSQIMTAPVSLLVPVLAITSITSEWSQRTGLVSFTLEPHRMRVVLAKLVTVLLLALASVALAIVLGALGNLAGAIVAGADPVWNLGLGTLIWTVLSQVLYFMMAFGLGLVLLSTPTAIAIYYVFALVLPIMLYGPLMVVFDWARDIIPWIDLGFATSPYLGQTVDGTSTTTMLQLICAVTIWIVVPFVVGLRRVVIAEPK